ncbi:hypothetical protein [Streptomyces sp. WZ-12]|uniref:hypothetical protein n=1 Tax=Streptomyces sp. WZ-12 TaxID=3030210 RepID=UPI0023813B57|nr:hypothetical protein [Streptomyces sp. WZ-12]
MPGAEVAHQIGAEEASTASYGWIIDIEHEPSGGRDETGTMGPRNIAPQIEARLRKGEGRTFRMYDADQVLNYTGRIITSEDDEGNEDDFAPLDGFGEPNVGCTEIHYFDSATQSWREL